MTVPRKGWRKLTVDGHRYFWRAMGDDGGINVVVVTEAAFVKGATSQQLRFSLDYDSLRTPWGQGYSLTQRAAVSPGVVALAIRAAVGCRPSFTGAIGADDITLPHDVMAELQARARLEVAR